MRSAPRILPPLFVLEARSYTIAYSEWCICKNAPGNRTIAVSPC